MDNNSELWRASRYVRIVRSEVAPEIEADWNAWYNAKHLPDLLTVPGYISGRRLRRVDKPHEYISIWELSDPNAPFSKAIEPVKGNGPFSDKVTASGISYEELFRLSNK